MLKQSKNTLTKKSKSSKSRDLRASDRLNELIDIYNYAPPNALKSWQTLEKEVSALRNQNLGLYEREWNQMKAKFLENAAIEQFKEFPDLKKCLQKQRLFRLWFQSARDMYQHYDYFRQKFDGIVELNYWKDDPAQKSNGGFDVFLMTENQSVVTVSDKGKYQVKTLKDGLDLLIEAVEDVDAKYLRRCSNCFGIFLANDLRQIYCSEKCRNRKNTKIFVSKPGNKERLLKEKQEKYKVRKEIEEKEAAERRKKQLGIL